MRLNQAEEAILRHLILAACATLPLLSCVSPEPVVRKAWARDTGGRTATAAVFMTISSGRTDRLVGASTPAAARTDLMTMETTGGTMSMRYVQGIAVPARTNVNLNPTGLHVWLERLAKPLRAGSHFPLTLTFEHAGDRQVEVEVIAPSAPAPR